MEAAASGSCGRPGGEDLNFDAKAVFRLDRDAEMTVSLQDIHRDPVYRFYRPTQSNANDRTGVSAILRAPGPGGWLERVEARVYYQRKEDRRDWYTDASMKTRVKTGVARWETRAAGVQGTSDPAGGARVSWGLSYQRDDGLCPDDEQFMETNLSTGVTTKAAPDSVWENAALFAQLEWDLSVAAMLTAGVRVDRFVFESKVDALYDPPGTWDPTLDAFRETRGESSGGLSLLLRASDEVRLVASWFRGFRFWPPKFGATQHGYGVVVPTGTLPPVIGDTFETGAKVRVRDGFEGSLFLYNTRFRRNQVIVRGTFEGQDWFDFDGDGIRDPNEDVYVNRSTGEAYVYGVELEGTLPLAAGWKARAGFAWNIGKDLETGEPIRHTQPARFVAGLRWEDADPKGSGGWFEVVADLVGRYDRIPADRLANDVGYRRDPQDLSSPLVRSYGLPGYTVVAARGGLNLGGGVSVSVAVENLTDRRFRRAHSRWDEAGTNVLVGLTLDK